MRVSGVRGRIRKVRARRRRDGAAQEQLGEACWAAVAAAALLSEAPVCPGTRGGQGRGSWQRRRLVGVRAAGSRPRRVRAPDEDAAAPLVARLLREQGVGHPGPVELREKLPLSVGRVDAREASRGGEEGDDERRCGGVVAVAVVVVGKRLGGDVGAPQERVLVVLGGAQREQISRQREHPAAAVTAVADRRNQLAGDEAQRAATRVEDVQMHARRHGLAQSAAQQLRPQVVEGVKDDHVHGRLHDADGRVQQMLQNRTPHVGARRSGRVPREDHRR